MTLYNLTWRKDVRDLVDEFAGCGVWTSGPPPIRQNQTFADWLDEMRKDREGRQKSVENPCIGCGCNRAVYDHDRQKKLLICDYLLASSSAVERLPGRSFASTMKDYAEIHSSCERPYYKEADDCKECPLSRFVKVDVGMRSGGLPICEVFERHSPRKHVEQIRPISGDGMPLARAGEWRNRFGGEIK